MSIFTPAETYDLCRRMRVELLCGCSVLATNVAAAVDRYWDGDETISECSLCQATWTGSDEIRAATAAMDAVLSDSRTYSDIEPKRPLCNYRLSG